MWKIVSFCLTGKVLNHTTNENKQLTQIKTNNSDLIIQSFYARRNIVRKSDNIIFAWKVALNYNYVPSIMMQFSI